MRGNGLPSPPRILGTPSRLIFFPWSASLFNTAPRLHPPRTAASHSLPSHSLQPTRETHLERYNLDHHILRDVPAPNDPPLCDGHGHDSAFRSNFAELRAPAMHENGKPKLLHMAFRYLQAPKEAPICHTIAGQLPNLCRDGSPVTIPVFPVRNLGKGRGGVAYRSVLSTPGTCETSNASTCWGVLPRMKETPTPWIRR